MRRYGTNFLHYFVANGEFGSATSDGLDLNSPQTPFYNYLIYAGIAVTIQLIFGWSYAFPDGRPACSEDDDDSRNIRMCGLERSLRFSHMQLRFLTAFVLGGYVASTVYLWRLRRTNYTALCGATRNLIIQIATLIPDSDDEATSKAKIAMARWAMLGYELAILKARGQMDSDGGRKHLQSLGLLSETDDSEWDNMVEGDRHTTVWYWIQRNAVSLAKNGVLTELWTVCSAVTSIRHQANDLMGSISRDQPLPYTSAVGFNVLFSMITMTLWKGVQWAIWFYETNGRVYTEPRMYVEIATLALYTTIFAVLVDIDKILYNPFGQRDIDIPHDAVSGGLRVLARRLCSSTRCFPPVGSNDDAKFMGDEETNQQDAQDNIAYVMAEVAGGPRTRRTILPGVNQRNQRTPTHGELLAINKKIRLTYLE